MSPLQSSLVFVSISAVAVLASACPGLRGLHSDRGHHAPGAPHTPDEDAGADEADLAHDAGVEPGCRLPRPCEGGIRIPDEQHFVAPGLCARAVAVQQDELRQIAFAPNGDLFAVTATGEIRRYRDLDCDGSFASTAPERVLWASTGGNGNNLHIDAAAGYLYAGVPNGVKRWRYDPALDAGTDEQSVVVNQPSTGDHTDPTVHVFDGFLYVHSGSAENVVDSGSPAYDDDRSLIKRFALAGFDPSASFEWTGGEVYALGLLDMVGYTQHPNGDLYGVMNGIVRLAQGEAYAPIAVLDAHSGPLDIAFLAEHPKALPERWAGGAFVTLHGSWDRDTSTGHKVVWIPFSADGSTAQPYQVVFGGGRQDTSEPARAYEGAIATDGAWGWSAGGNGEDLVRPVGVAVSPVDGALYVSSDNARVGSEGPGQDQGALYRIARY